MRLVGVRRKGVVLASGLLLSCGTVGGILRYDRSGPETFIAACEIKSNWSIGDLLKNCGMPLRAFERVGKPGEPCVVYDSKRVFADGSLPKDEAEVELYYVVCLKDSTLEGLTKAPDGFALPGVPERKLNNYHVESVWIYASTGEPPAHSNQRTSETPELSDHAGSE